MLPDSHQNLAESLLLSSQIHAARNRLAMADSTGRFALSMYRMIPGVPPMTVAWSLATLAGIVSRQGKYAEAGSLLREALQAYRSVVGDLHPSTLLTMASLAENELWLGNARAALEWIVRAAPPLDSIWGDRATLAAPLTTWGIALADLGRCAEASPHLERAARLARARWDDTSLAVTVPARYLQRCGGRAK
jgi:tetratricopeptide (TPR) repeat protein